MELEFFLWPFPREMASDDLSIGVDQASIGETSRKARKDIHAD
jgi:hypothetical protein